MGATLNRASLAEYEQLWDDDIRNGVDPDDDPRIPSDIKDFIYRAAIEKWLDR